MTSWPADARHLDSAGHRCTLKAWEALRRASLQENSRTLSAWLVDSARRIENLCKGGSNLAKTACGSSSQRKSPRPRSFKQRLEANAVILEPPVLSPLGDWSDLRRLENQPSGNLHSDSVLQNYPHSKPDFLAATSCGLPICRKSRRAARMTRPSFRLTSRHNTVPQSVRTSQQVPAHCYPLLPRPHSPMYGRRCSTAPSDANARDGSVCNSLELLNPNALGFRLYNLKPWIVENTTLAILLLVTTCSHTQDGDGETWKDARITGRRGHSVRLATAGLAIGQDGGLTQCCNNARFSPGAA